MVRREARLVSGPAAAAARNCIYGTTQYITRSHAHSHCVCVQQLYVNLLQRYQRSTLLSVVLSRNSFPDFRKANENVKRKFWPKLDFDSFTSNDHRTSAYRVSQQRCLLNLFYI